MNLERGAQLRFVLAFNNAIKVLLSPVDTAKSEKENVFDNTNKQTLFLADRQASRKMQMSM